jgi:hypothetical protein
VMRNHINRLGHYTFYDFNKKMSYGKTGSTSAVTKLGWTVFEEVQTKNGKWWQCKVDFISKTSIVRSVRPDMVLPSLITIQSCSILPAKNHAKIRHIVSKKVRNVHETEKDSAISVFRIGINSSQNNQFVTSCACKTIQRVWPISWRISKTVI